MSLYRHIARLTKQSLVPIEKEPSRDQYYKKALHRLHDVLLNRKLTYPDKTLWVKVDLEIPLRIPEVAMSLLEVMQIDPDLPLLKYLLESSLERLEVTIKVENNGKPVINIHPKDTVLHLPLLLSA